MGTCSRCGNTDEVNLPKLNDTDYSYVVVTRPSCTETGHARYTWKVTGYGVFSFDAVLSATGHSYTGTVTEPTCVTQGYTTYTCINCADTYKDDYVAARGHDLVIDAAVAPTCTKMGLTAGEHCSQCDYVTEQEYIPALGHAYKYAVLAPTCTEQGSTTHTCTRCDYSYTDSYVSALGHLWDEGQVIEAPTETTEGLRRFTCTRCGVIRNESIPALGHTHKYETVVTAPTCTKQGFTTHTCSCGDSFVDTYVAALGHDAVIDKAVNADCTNNGLSEGKHCARCGMVLVIQESIPALGHAWDKGIVTIEPTETSEGVRTYTCTRCGETKAEPIPAVGPVALPFVDVAEKNYFYDPVVWAVKNNITMGTDSSHFSPEAPCTRGQVVTFLWRAAGQPEPTQEINPFSDVKPSDYFYKAVLWAVEQGITTGTSRTTFSPEDACTRAQVVTFQYRTHGKPEVFGNCDFTDIKATDYYYNAVIWAVQNQITKGTSNTAFSPDDTCTRAQIVTFLYRDYAE